MSLYHFYSSYEPQSPDARQRMAVARMTWDTQMWKDLPVLNQEMPRLWKEEGLEFPFILDLFDKACYGRDDNDILIYTNADLCVVSNCALKIVSFIQDTDAFFSMRRDFNHDFSEPVPDDLVLRADAYVGSDLYGFRARWWKTHRKSYPEMILAHEAWDAVLRELIIHTNPGKPVSLPDISYHRRHASRWEAAENRNRLRGQWMNKQNAKTWMKARGLNPASHGL